MFKNQKTNTSKSSFDEEVLDFIMQNPLDYDFADLNFDIGNILIEYLPSDWKRRFEYSSEYIVKNVKGRGFPDIDEILNILEQRDIATDNKIIKKYFEEGIFDEQFFAWVQDQINYNLLEDYPNFTVLGRSGGWWGLPLLELPFDNILFIDTDSVINLINEYKEIHEGGELLIESAANWVFNSLDEMDIIVNPEVLDYFTKLDQKIETIIKNAKNPQIWADDAEEFFLAQQ